MKSLDADLQRWRELERMQVTQATPVPTATPAPSPRLVGTVPRITVKPNVPIGSAFIRSACALMMCQGNKYEAAEYAKRWDDSTPEVSLYLKAAVAAGTVTDATWAAPLVNQSIADDFLALLRPATILGKIPGPAEGALQHQGPVADGRRHVRVGRGSQAQAGHQAGVLDSETLGISKVAGIIVLTEELVRLSNPSAEALVRADMVAGIAAFLDQQFIDPAVAAVAGVNPASITNGAPTAAATINPLADIMGLINHFADQQHPGRWPDLHHVAGQCAVAVLPHLPGRLVAVPGRQHEWRQLQGHQLRDQRRRRRAGDCPAARLHPVCRRRRRLDRRRRAKRRCRWTARRPRRPMPRP